MKFIRNLFVAAALWATALFSACAPAAGVVTVNNTAVCSTGAALALSLTGDVAITCTGSTTVTPPPPPPTCTSPAIAGIFGANGGRFNFAISRGGYAAFSVPQFDPSVVNHTYYQFASIQDTRTQANLPVEFALSTCVGEFNVPAACKAFGVAESGSTSVMAFAGPRAGACGMTAGVQYYLNVRNVLQDETTPGCNVTTCFLYATMNQGFF